MELHEEQHIAEQLSKKKIPLKNSDVQRAVQDFVRLRRSTWKKEGNDKAIKEERKFANNDEPSLVWCGQFLSRNKLISGTRKRVSNLFIEIFLSF